MGTLYLYSLYVRRRGYCARSVYVANGLFIAGDAANDLNCNYFARFKENILHDLNALDVC